MKRTPARTIKFGALSKAERNRKIMAIGKGKVGKYILKDLQRITSNIYSTPCFNFTANADSLEIAQRIVDLTIR